MSAAPTGIRSRGVPLDHEVLGEVKRLARAGWVDHVVIRDRHGQTLIHVPLAVGLAAFVLAPVWAALGAMASMKARCTIDIELRDQPTPPEEWPPEPGPDVDEDPPTTRR